LQPKYDPLLFQQSGGYCDSSSTMCDLIDEFIIEDQDVFIGNIGGWPIYIGKAQYEYWKHTQLIIDVVGERGGMFSLEGPEGMRC
jgi:uncharacterized protein